MLNIWKILYYSVGIICWKNKNVFYFLCNFSEAMAMDALMKIETNALHTKKLAFLQTYMAQMARMSQFGELPDVFVDIWQFFLRKCQNRQFFDRKCTTLVTLVETGFQCYQIAGLPDMNIFGQTLAIFGFFSKNFGGKCAIFVW